MAENNESTMKWKVDVTQLKSAMQEAKRAMNQANAEFKTATAGMDKWSKSSEGLEAKLNQLNKLLPAQKRQLEILEASYAETVKTMGENSSAAADLKIKIEAQKATIIKTESSINSYTKQLKDMQDAENSLTSTISKQESELKNLKEAYVNAVAQYGKNSSEAKNLANQIQDLSGELADNKKKAQDAASAADKLDATIEDAGNAAESSKGKFEGFGQALANAAKAGIAAFAGAVAGAVTGLTKASVDAAAYADEMITLSTVTGMSKESLQAYSYAADLVDVSMETLTGSMAKNIKSMSSAQEGTGAAAEAYARLGVAVTDSEGNLRDGEAVYWECIDALGQMEEGADRDALAMQLFGKSAQDLNPLIAQGSEGINELTEEAKAMGAVLSDDQLADLGSFDDSIQRLSQGADAAKRALGLVLLPELQTLADEGVSLLGEFTTGLIQADGDWSKISEVIGSTVGSVANTLLQQLPNIISVATSMVTALGSAFVDNLPTIVSTLSQAAVQLALAFAKAAPSMVDAGQKAVIALIQGLAQAAPELIAAIPPMIQGILDATIQNLPLILQAGITLIQAVLSGIQTALPELINYIPILIQEVCAFITENLPFLLDSGMQILMELLNGILEAAPMILEQLPLIIDTIVECIMTNLPLILQAGIQILMGLINGIVNAIPQLIAMLPTIITTIINVITQNLPLIIQLGMQTLVQLISGLTSALPQLISFLPQIIMTIVSTLVQNLPAILKMGAEILWELIKGIGSVIGELVKQVGVVVKTIFDEIAKLPGQMLSIGSDIVSGIWKGISDGYDWICKKISSWVSDVVDFIKKKLGIASPSKVMRDVIGKNMALGIAEGISAGTGAVNKAFTDLTKQMLNTGAGAYKETAKSAIKLANDAIVSGLQESKNVVQKSIDDYFNDLLEANQKEQDAIERGQKSKFYIDSNKRLKNRLEELKEEKTKLSQLYKDFSKDVMKQYEAAITTAADGISDELSKKLQDIADTAQKKIDETNKSISSMQKKLSGYGDLYTKGSSGLMRLNDIKKQTEAIQRYDKQLNQLKGKISGELMQEIVGMNVADANQYMTLLLQMTDKDLKEYDDLYSEKVKTAEKVSNAFYADEVSAVKKEYTDKVQQAFKDARDEIADIGKQTIKGFFKGMESVNIDASVKSIADSIISTMKKTLKISSPSKVFEQLGEFSGEGYVMGLTSSMNDLKDIVASDIESMTGQNMSSGQTVNNHQVVNFNQTINSPKAVDGMTLYRETNNLLFSAKVRLGNV